LRSERWPRLPPSAPDPATGIAAMLRLRPTLSMTAVVDRPGLFDGPASIATAGMQDRFTR